MENQYPPTENSIPPTELQWMENLTSLMDDRFRIPGTNIRFGLDPILGLFPWLGDFVGLLISGIMVIASIRYKVSGKVLLFMTSNLIFDYIISSIPLIGDIFDVSYKANRRNLNLLKEHIETGKYQGSGKGIIILTLLVFFGFCVLLIYGLIRLIQFILEQVQMG